MLSFAMLAVTYDQDNPRNVAKWSVSGMKDLHGKEHGPWEGQKALHFMSQFDVVALWHWPSPVMVEMLHEQSVQVLPILEIADVKTYPEWCRINEELRSVLAGPLPIRRESNANDWATFDNRFDQPFIDAYEAAPGNWDQKPHVWSVDINKSIAFEAYMGALRRVMELYKLEQRPDGFFIDTHIKLAYFGTASNKPEIRPVNHWRNWDAGISGLFAPVWGHSAQETHDCWYTIEEWALRDHTLGELASLVQHTQESGRYIGLAPNQGPSDMAKLSQLVDMGFEPDYVQSARSGMYCTPEVDLLGE
jgi:hypothetical protein